MKIDKTTLVDCCSTPLNWTLIASPSNHTIERADCTRCQTDYLRKDGGNKIYILGRNIEAYRCASCGFDAVVAQPPAQAQVQNRAPSLNILGEWLTEASRGVIYCPRCEEEPVFEQRVR